MYVNLTIASTPCSWVGLNGWSTTSSPIMPGGGVSMELDCRVVGIDVTPAKSCGVFGALAGSDGSSCEQDTLSAHAAHTITYIVIPFLADASNISTMDR